MKLKVKKQSTNYDVTQRTGFRMVLLGMIAFFLVLDVLQTSAVSTRGYDISEYQNQLHMLEQDNQALMVQISQFRSMESIQQRLAGLNMVPAGSVEYIQVGSAAVAQR